MGIFETCRDTTLVNETKDSNQQPRLDMFLFFLKNGQIIKKYNFLILVTFFEQNQIRINVLNKNYSLLYNKYKHFKFNIVFQMIQSFVKKYFILQRRFLSFLKICQIFKKTFFTSSIINICQIYFLNHLQQFCISFKITHYDI